MTDDDELAAWLTLLATPRLGRTAVRSLLARFGSPQGLLGADTVALHEAGASALVEALKTPPDDLAGHIAATIAWRAAPGDAPRRVITLGDADYPPQLLESPDPPLLLYTIGRVELLRAESLAVVGSRNPTPQGRENAHAFAATLSQAGLGIVSGLALGIDAAAHEGGLEGSGSTIAVVGTGLDRVYPRRHHALAHRIAQQGLIVSEYGLGAPPLAAHFPQRNRIIAGLSRGTLVVEAALQSGSLITARLAAEAGREVFAIPGSIHSPLTRGCHALIQQGAKLVLSADDVLDELRPGRPAAAAALPAAVQDAAEDPLLDVMGFDPLTLDALVERTGWPPATLHARLLDLELEGRVARLPGQRFQRIGRA